jgi:hypothetical protein
MSNITPPIGTPKNVNDLLRSAAGLDPDNPNDMAFKLVTILYFFVSQKLTFFLEQRTRISPLFVSHSCVVSHCATSASTLASLALLSRREGGGGAVPRHFQGALGLAAAGRKGGGGRTLAFWGGSIATPSATGREGGVGGGRAAAFWGSQHPRNGRVGERQWARCGVKRMAFLRWR